MVEAETRQKRKTDGVAAEKGGPAKEEDSKQWRCGVNEEKRDHAIHKKF